MPLELTPGQRDRLAEAATKSWPMPTRVDDLAPTIAQMLADERERIARAIEAVAVERFQRQSYRTGYDRGLDDAARIVRGLS